VTLAFDKQDSRVRSGMTANIDILSARSDNVIAVPTRSVIRQSDGPTIVRILDATGKLVDVPVTTGLRGSDGNTEITSGIHEGDNVVVFIPTS
jgi:multidrug efflux pump subunit AcrA (membrane-fusion protein)